MTINTPAGEHAELERWVTALQERHLSNLRFPEVTRALRALSSSYVERRGQLEQGAPLSGAGKRAAFALYYAPLHFLTTLRIVEALSTVDPLSIVDLGCGTGAAGAAWAIAAGRRPNVLGIDRHPWAVDEARWTYRHFSLRAQARRGDATRLPPAPRGSAVIAAFALNEMPDEPRRRVETALIAAARNGVRVLIIEPIARSVTPWWDETAARFAAVGGRTDDWRFEVELPSLLRLLDKAAGLRHDELTARSLYCPGA